MRKDIDVVVVTQKKPLNFTKHQTTKETFGAVEFKRVTKKKKLFFHVKSFFPDCRF